MADPPSYSVWASVIAGGVAAAGTKTLTAPLSRLTILLQVYLLWFLVYLKKNRSLYF
jgi:hypothetical protein